MSVLDMVSDLPTSLKPWLSSIEEIIEEARQGRMFILADAENRENEGDLIIVAEKATPESINFMARYGRGLICLALSQQRVNELRLPLMNPKNADSMTTAFTVSIEAKEGVTTGISAADRAHTIATAIDPHKTFEDISSPGHMFPLIAREDGVLARPGHTEAAVDIARLAGCNPSGVICEIMNDDGTMARMPELIAFAQKHGLKITTVEALIQYRQAQEEQLILLGKEALRTKELGTWNMNLFRDPSSQSDHMAATIGRLPKKGPVLTRIQPLSFDMSKLEFDFDLFHDLPSLDPDEIPVDLLLCLGSMAFISRHKPGIIVCPLIPQDIPSMRVLPPVSQANLEISAKILKTLGIEEVRPLLHPKEKMWDLAPFGIITHPKELLGDLG